LKVESKVFLYIPDQRWPFFFSSWRRNDCKISNTGGQVSLQSGWKTSETSKRQDRSRISHRSSKDREYNQTHGL